MSFALQGPQGGFSGSPIKALMKPTQSPILIIGAGVVGLVLAQALKKFDVPFKIFERDRHIDYRGDEWGITIHWALLDLMKLLPEELYNKLNDIQVDPKHGNNHDNGGFVYLDLATGRRIWDLKPSHRLRINREKFRKLLLDGIDVQWGKCLTNLETTPEGVQVRFTDFTTEEGSILIGADGADSTVRRLLCPKTGSLNQLPFECFGATIKLGREDIKPFRSVDPLLFHGCDSETKTFMCFSILASPEVNGSADSKNKDDYYYTAQIHMSWPSLPSSRPVPASEGKWLDVMKFRAANFHPVIREVVQEIPEGTEIKEIKLADWPCLEWPNFEGKVTLIGDAAHAMTMYRPEAANHGIMDAAHLFRRIVVLVDDPIDNSFATQAEAIEMFEMEMRRRTSWAVKMSRQACFDAHDYLSLTEDSAILVEKRWVYPK